MFACPQFVPFIQGPRNCLGQYFALLEARIVVGLLVKVSRARSLHVVSFRGCRVWNALREVLLVLSSGL